VLQDGDLDDRPAGRGPAAEVRKKQDGGRQEDQSDAERKALEGKPHVTGSGPDSDALHQRCQFALEGRNSRTDEIALPERRIRSLEEPTTAQSSALSVTSYAYQEITALSVQESRDCLEDRMRHALVVLPVFLEIPTAAPMLLTATLAGYLAARDLGIGLLFLIAGCHIGGDTCHASLTSFTSAL
jgi:hypothetical protein